MDLGKRVLVEFLLKSCKGNDFGQFRSTYNQLKEKWSLSETKAMLLQEEARQKEELKTNPPQANFVYNEGFKAGSSSSKSSRKGKKETVLQGAARKGKGKIRQKTIKVVFGARNPGI